MYVGLWVGDFGLDFRGEIQGVLRPQFQTWKGSLFVSERL
jgi:hypothetical protein